MNLVEWLSAKYQVPVPLVREYGENPHWEIREGVEGYFVDRLPILHIYKHATGDKDLIVCHEFHHYVMAVRSKGEVVEKSLAVEDYVQTEAELDLAEYRDASYTS